MHEPGKSDSCVVPRKVLNKARRRAAEGLEGRRLGKRNSLQATTLRTSGPGASDTEPSVRGRRAAGTDKLPRLAIGDVSRHYASQEPGAVVPHAGICGGGGQQWLSLLR